MNGDINETNDSHLCSTSSNTPRKQQQQNNRRRAFFHDDVIVNDNQINSTIDDTIEENLLLAIPNHHEGNPTNKSFKRKAVSFSAMPYEKKVADGKEIFSSLFICWRIKDFI
jgi:hypothetical protein